MRLVFPLTFVSSAFVPTDTMPDWMRIFAENQPMTHVVNAVRDLTLGTDLYDAVVPSILWSLGFLVVFFPHRSLALQPAHDPVAPTGARSASGAGSHSSNRLPSGSDAQPKRPMPSMTWTSSSTSTPASRS